MAIRPPIIFLALALCLPTAAHLETLADYAYQSRIRTHADGPFFHFPLTLEVYRGTTSPDLRDLRVFNAAGETLPYALTMKLDLPQAHTEETNLRIFPLYREELDRPDGLLIRRQQDGSLVSIESTKPKSTRNASGAILDASRIDLPIVALEIALEHYERAFQRFRIEASDDLINWQTVLESASIAMLDQDGVKLEQRRIDLPGSRAKYLRLTWPHPEDAPRLAKVTAISSSTPPSLPAQLLWTEQITPLYDRI